jgi:6-phosphogluconolactonase (cycloisomerase 2 family)
MARFALLIAVTKRLLCVTSALAAAGTLLAACDDNATSSVKLTKTNSSAPPSVTYITKFAYLANGGGSNVGAYSVNTTTGALTLIGAPFSTAAGSSPHAIALDPAGKFLFTANQASDKVSAFTIDPMAGTLTDVPGSPFAAGDGPYSLVVDPSGKFLYVANNLNTAPGNSVSAYAINGTTGVLSPVPGSPFSAGVNPIGVTVDPTGRYAYVAAAGSGVQAYVINGTTGALSPVGAPLGASGSPFGVVVDPSGKFVYATNGGTNTVSVYAITLGTGALTLVGTPVAAGSLPSSITVDPSGKYAFVVNESSASISAYSIDAITGALSEIIGSPFPNLPLDLTLVAIPVNPVVDPSGRFLYVATGFGTKGATAFAIGADGGLTAIAGFPLNNGLNSTAIAIARVPQ